MPLPAGFPMPPRRPETTVAMASADGKITSAWANYFTALDRWNAQVRQYLDSL